MLCQCADAHHVRSPAAFVQLKTSERAPCPVAEGLTLPTLQQAPLGLPAHPDRFAGVKVRDAALIAPHSAHVLRHATVVATRVGERQDQADARLSRLVDDPVEALAA